MGELPAARPRALRFEGAALLIADGRLTRWSIPSRSVGHRAVAPVGLSSLAFSPDGAQLLIAGGGGYLGRVETDTGALSAVEPLGDSVVKSVAFRGDGAAAATGMAAPYLRVGGATFSGARSYRRIGFLGDGALVGLGIRAGLWWWPSQGAEPPEALGQERAFVDLEAGDAGELWVLDAQGAVDRLRPGPLQLEPVASAPGAVAIDVAGGRLAIASANAITVRPVGGGPPVVLAAPGAGIKDIAFSFDGAYLIAGGADTIARVWRVSDGRRVAELAGHTERISALEAHPHAPLIATVSWDHSLRLWDLSALDPSPASLAAAIEASWGGGGP
jgi:WD40 repeat protein